MKKTFLMSAAKKARIALAVMAVCGFTFAGAQSAFAENVTVDYNSNIIGGNDSSVTSWGRAPRWNVVLGFMAKAKGDSNVAIGDGASAEGIATAVGAGSVAKNDGTAMGHGAEATGEYSIALGVSAKASANGAVALGLNSTADEENTVSVGGIYQEIVGYDPATRDPIYENKLLTRKIVNVADGTKNTDAATFGQIIKAGEYNLELAADGSGQVTLKTNAGANGPTIKVDASALAGASGPSFDGTKLNTAIQDVDVAGGYKETTANANADTKGTIAGAINSAYQAGKDYTDTQVGTLSSLSTTEKGNLVGAVNEVKGTADAAKTKANDAFTQATTNKTSIGTLTSLTTTEKGNLVGAVNEVKGTADSALAQANTNKTNIGSLSADGKYIKQANNVSANLVELDKQVNTNTTAIAGKADLGLSNINAAGETVIKNLAKTEAGTVVAGELGTITSTNYVSTSKKVNENISALDKQVKANEGAITAVDNKIGTIAGGTYIEAGKNVAENLGKLDTQVKANADDIITANTNITKVDNKIGSLSADGTYIKQANNVSANLVELDKQVNTNTTAIAGKADLGLSNINAAGETVIKNLAKTEAGTVVAGELGTITSTNYVSTSKKVNENISALDVQVKANEGAITAVDNKIGTIAGGTYIEAGKNVAENLTKLDTQVKANADDIITANTNITKVDNKIGSLSADGTYIKQANNVSANLVELDKQVKTNTSAIADKADKNLSNISAAGKDVIINLAGSKAGEVLDVKLGAITSTHYVNAGNSVNANISALDTQLNKVDNKVGTMTDGEYISAGNTVAGNLSALDAQLKNNTDAIADKADKNLSNITDAGKNVIKDLASDKAGEVVADKLGTITSNNYVNAGNTVNANISKLDEQVKANADAINTKADKDLSNITDAGKNVIKNLASVKAGEVVDAKLGDITSNNYVNAGNTVNANISALDKQMKVNTDNIGDTSKLTNAGLGSNLSDAVVNVNNKVGTADELKALKDAGLGDNLAQATAAVNKKADKNAEDIKNVNGRVDELGGRVDTLGGAVSKLDSKVNKVGAGAAALAALHPMEFDSDNKLSFAAGVGNYRGANAAAIGAFYRPNEQVMFSIAGNMGNGENMVNAGISFALDRPSKTPTTKAALVKTVAAQNEQIAALNETLAEQNEKIARLEAMVEKLAAKQNA